MTAFALHPWDFFFGGLAFLWMAAVAYGLRRQPGEKWPWAWLAWFGLIHAAGLWLDMLTGGRSEAPPLLALRLALAAGSLVALFEFGRRGIRLLSGRPWGTWAYAALIGLVALATLIISLLDATAFCAVAGLGAQLAGAACALLAASALWRRGHRWPAGRSRLFAHWQLPVAAVLVVAIGWTSAHWRDGEAKSLARTATTDKAAATDANAAGYVEVEVEIVKPDETASRESMAVRRLRSGLPLMLVCLGLSAVVLTMWALSHRAR